MAISSPLLTPERQRILLMFGAGFVALLVIYFAFFRRDYVVLYRDLRAADAAAIVGELERQSVPYRLGRDSGEILVPSARAEAARISIAGADLSLGGVDGFELFNDADMGLTDFAQKIKYQRAIQGELARTIMTLDGVAEARVHISIPERTLFRAERQRAEAAITLLTRNGEDFNTARIEGVQRLVAASVPDLDVADVVVLNAAGEVLSPTQASLGAPSQAPSLSVEASDPVADAVRATLAGIDVQVSIEARQPALPLAGAEDGGDSSIAPAPTEIVHVSTLAPLNVDQQRAVRAALYELNLEGRAIEAVAFHAGADGPLEWNPREASSPEAGAAFAPQASPVPRPLNPASMLGWLSALGLIGAALIALFMLRARTHMSAQEHVDFAERLRLGLSREEGAHDVR